jgi:Zn-dependent M28 family amino/carboxypeptidase
MMTGLRTALGLIGLCLVVACATARRLPPSTDIDEDLFRDGVRTLASDEFEGRRPGTSGEDKTIAYLTAQFRRLGMKPGNGDSFVQSVPMLELSRSAPATLSITANGLARAYADGKETVLWAPGGLGDASIQQSELVFAGFGIVAPEYGWNDYADLDVRGKTVLVLSGDPGRAGDDPTLFKGRATTYFGRWSYKLAEAARQGASGVLLIHDADVARFGWDQVVNRWSGPQLTLVPAPASADGRVLVAGWVSGAAARAIFKQAGQDFVALSAAATHTGFKARPLGLHIDAEVPTSVRRFTSFNVIALWPGARRPHDYIVYSAHWDGLGRAPGHGGDDIYHGAVDNASGVAGLLALAQSFKRTLPPPDRSIVFMALTGGEAELLGSTYYVANPIFPLRSTVADINMDALHVGGPTRDVTVIGFGQSELEGYLRDLAALQGRELHADPNPEAGDFYRTDSFRFAQAGVPSLYAYGGIDDSARGPAWGRAQIDDYFTHRYLQLDDRYSDDWDVRGTIEDLTLYYRIGQRLAQTRRFPNWFATSEFRAARARSREDATD